MSDMSASFPFSGVETVIKNALPVVFDVFGVDAILTRALDFDEIPVRVITGTDVEPVGDYGERVAARFVLDSACSDGAVFGDVFEIAGRADDGEIDADPIYWKATEVLTDDGLIRRFRVEPLAQGEQ